MVFMIPQTGKIAWGVLALAGMSSLALACGPSETSATPAALGEPASSSPPTVQPASPSASEVPLTQSSGDAAARDLSGGANRRSPFVPLDNPEFLTAEDASFLGDDNLIMGLELEGQARAYPIGMVYYHHVVNDMVDGRPMLVTY
ncbi:MAG: DUF3179 domain-containing (seleno)protein [SAR202 cluster bacterium]|nr:DUF3179 domain-containing (seleno)protein [SAR202 cluster bacterium]